MVLTKINTLIGCHIFPWFNQNAWGIFEKADIVSLNNTLISEGIRVRIQQELDVVAFWPWNLDVVVFLVLESRCHGFLSSEKTPWNHDVVAYVSVSRCRGFLVLESWCRGFLVLEPRCRSICASTASFSFSLNLLCHIINVNMWVVNYANYFVSHKLVF